MRPRINRKEAAYLVGVLTAQHEELKQKYDNINQLEFDMRQMLFDLKHPVQVEYTDTGYFNGHRIVGPEETLAYIHIYEQLKAEHPNIIAEKFRLYEWLTTHQKLIEKYSAIAEGVTHRGTYKHLNNSPRFR